MRTSLLLLLIASAACAQTPNCTLVEGDQILGSDLARAVPAFRLVQPATRITAAPLPGGMRVLSEPELESLGTRFGVRIPILSAPVCFRVSTAPLNSTLLMEAMQKSLNMPDARIELIDISPEPAPGGTIVFPIASLGRPAAVDSPSLWRGEVVSGARHFNIWARVRVLAPLTRIVAIEPLNQNTPIQEHQIRAEAAEGFPSFSKMPTIESVVGMLPSRSVAAGAEVRAEYLARPLDVARGEMVRVDVRLGRAHLALAGRAETGGRTGDMVSVRNPESSRVFQARVEGRGRVLVEPQVTGED